MVARRRNRIAALFALSTLSAGYFLWPPSAESLVEELVTDLARSGGLAGQAEPASELRAKLERTLAPSISLFADGALHGSVGREEAVRRLLEYSRRFEGQYSLYDLHVVVHEQGSAAEASRERDENGEAVVEAMARGRVGPADRRNQYQGLDAHEFVLRLVPAGDSFQIRSIEVLSDEPMEPEARP